jgi:hypothetical protein
MGYIPPDTKWWLADLILQFTIDGKQGNCVHTILRWCGRTPPSIRKGELLAVANGQLETLLFDDVNL